MLSKQKKQIQTLQRAAKDKRQRTIEKVKNTLEEMQAKDLPINIRSVAKMAGISKTWLYNNHDLRDEIQQQRLQSGKIQRIIDLQSKIATRDKKIAHLKNRNQQQKEIIKKLRHQLEVVYGQLYKIQSG